MSGRSPRSADWTAFNNAGVMAQIAPTADSSLEEFERVTGVNLRGVWSCMKHELRPMERQGSGRDADHRNARVAFSVEHCI